MFYTKVLEKIKLLKPLSVNRAGLHFRRNNGYANASQYYVMLLNARFTVKVCNCTWLDNSTVFEV
jgi:hypothetical protein